jgi:undecaprenyl diphosphate synthase
MVRITDVTDGNIMQELDPSRLPLHIAIIMDGNGRWAEKHSLSRVRGHEAGVESVRDIVTACREIGIQYLTLYAFSMENWFRPDKEVKALMNILGRFLRKELATLLRNGVKLVTIGQIDSLPDKVQQILIDTIRETSENRNLVLNIALSYGGRDEILRAVRKIVKDHDNGKVNVWDLKSSDFSKYLYTSGIPDPDLLIRTSGEYRLSNFLLWQTAYTEFYFTDVLWPDFRRENLVAAILDYQKRERRFGLTSEQLPRE